MKTRLPELKLLNTETAWQQRNEVLSSFLRDSFRDRRVPIRILEAGCGRSWPLDMGNLRVELTGVDTDRKALEARVKGAGDLHRAIAGDLLEIDLDADQFDVVYSCEVLEHINGAEEVLKRFFTWLKPNGLAVLVFPDRDTVFGLATRFSPHWAHVAYHRRVMGVSDAGKPGFGPYRTYYDAVISRRGIHAFCAAHDVSIALEYGRPPALSDWSPWFSVCYNAIAPIFAKLSLGRICSSHIGLVYVIRKNGFLTNQ